MLEDQTKLFFIRDRKYYKIIGMSGEIIRGYGKQTNRKVLEGCQAVN